MSTLARLAARCFLGRTRRGGGRLLRGVPLSPSRADAVGSKMAGGGSGDGGANNQPTDPGGNDTGGNVLGNFWAVAVVAVAVVSS